MHRNVIKLGFLGVLLLNIFLLPVNVTPNVVAAASVWDDPDPVHIAQLHELIKAYQEGRLGDPVHIARAKEALATMPGAPTSQPAPAPAPAQPTPDVFAITNPVEQAKVLETIQSAPALTPTPVPVSSTALYVDPNSPAANQARQWSNWQEGAQKMNILAAQPTAKWFGGWSGNVEQAARDYVSAASSAGKTAVMIAYNIPGRDCGGYSAGGTKDYTGWISSFARGIGDRHAIVILEPDSLSLIDCLSQDDRDARYQLLSNAVSVLKSNPNTRVYLDAGHSNWHSTDVMAARLQKANIERADGFALNVSNFMPTSDEVAYGTAIAQKVGKRFVIDTSRNGNGSNGEWCNPWGRAIGQKPTFETGNNLIEAFLWLKTPGESDGTCNGGPSAGVWWPDYAMSLVR